LDKFCDLPLNRLPLDIRVAETGIQKHRRISEPGTVDMHPVATDVHQAARHEIRSPFTNETKVLVHEAAERPAKIRMAKVMRPSQFRNIRDTGRHSLRLLPRFEAKRQLIIRTNTVVNSGAKIQGEDIPPGGQELLD
jgi:hypothetical protein